MRSTAIDRRGLLGGLAGGLAVGCTGPVLAGAPGARARYVSANADGTGGFNVAVFAADGARLAEVALPARGHDVVPDPHGRLLVAVARRPGRWMLAIDAAGDVIADPLAPAGRHFYGHGVFSPGGGLFYTTENAFDREGSGRIGVWDVGGGWRRVGEFAAGGIGPHELVLMPDGDTLAVANGGILTHPDHGRAKLNLDRMRPNLTFLDRRDGRILAQKRLDPALFQLSIRHLDVASDGTVVAAFQHQGGAEEDVPLIGRQKGRDRIEPLRAPSTLERRMRNYCGAVRFDASGRIFAVSAPRGDVIGFWRADGRYLSQMRLGDGCGLAADGTPGGFLASSGTGTVVRVDARTGRRARLASRDVRARRWDNHLRHL